MPFCPECGTENTPDKKFCTNCGKPLVPQAASPAASPAAAPVPAGNPPVPPGTAAPPRSLPLPAIIAGVIILAVIAAGIYFVGLPLLTKNTSAAKGSATPVTTAYTAEPVHTAVPVMATMELTAEPTTMPATLQPVATPSAPSTGMFSSGDFGFEIQYPPNWEKNEYDALVSSSSSRYEVVEFKSPSSERCDTDKSSCETIYATVTVEVDNAPGTNEVADYYVAETTKLLRDYGATITKRDASYKLSGKKAYRFDYETDEDGTGVRLISAYTIINKKAYVITYRALAPVRGETDMFEQYYNDADAMFASFRAT